MKNMYLGALALACAGFSAQAQNPEPCGIEIPASSIEYLDQSRVERQKFNPFDLKSVRNIPVQHHIIRRSNGTGGLNPSLIPGLMNDLNTYYSGANIAFFECGPINFIDDDQYYDFTTSQESSIGNANDVDNVINVYYFNSVSSGSSYYCGYTRVPPSTIDRIVMANGCATNGSTFIHEFGHYFSLYHTHGKTNNGTTDELVNGSNCATAGDDVCDTPADPNLSGKVNSSCQYTGTGTDANGDAYNPDPSNIMSYSLKACRNYLSPGQINRVAYSAVNDRGYLQCDTSSTPPPAPFCSAVVQNFPYQENFESGFGLWTHDNTDDSNWLRNAGGTSSSATGPSSAAEGSFYAYIEASSPNFPSKTSYLESPCFKLSGLNSPELSFFYHMYGSAMGTFAVEAKRSGETNWTTLWSKTGNQGNSWDIAQVNLAAYASDTFKLRLRGTTGSSFTSDMAVDDIQIGNQRNCIRPLVSFPHLESFSYNSTGDWTQAGGDDLDWTIHSGATPSSNTGPNNARHGSYYAYVESSGQYYKTAILNSPCLDLSNISLPEFSFYYHMVGNSMGSLEVQVSTDGGQNWSGPIWRVSGNQGTTMPDLSGTVAIERIDPGFQMDMEQNPWLEASIDLGDFAGPETQVRLVAKTGNSYTSDIAVDALTFRSQACAHTVMTYPYHENFENEALGWVQESNDDIDWMSYQGATPSYGTGPNEAATGLKYMYVEASGSNAPQKKAGLISPCFDLSERISFLERYGINTELNLQITFSFHMYGADQGKLLVQISEDDGHSWTTRYSIEGAYGDRWYGGSVWLGDYKRETIRVRFLAETGDGPLSDIAIDNFTINVPIYITYYPVEPILPDADASALEQEEEKTILQVFPNPSQGRVQVNGLGQQAETIAVYDLLGQAVQQFTVNNRSMSLDLSQLPDGVYWLMIRNGNGDIADKQKIIIQH